MRLAAIVLVVASGCSSSKGPSCAEQALELDRFLSAMDHEPSIFQFSKKLKLVTRDDLPVLKAVYAPTVEVQTREFVFEGLLVGPDELAERLAARRQQLADAVARGREARDPDRVYLLVDESAPWDRVVAAVEAAAAGGFTTVAFVFAHTANLKPPPRSPIDDELDKIDAADGASGKATKLAETVKGVIKACPAMIEAFGRVAARDSDDKAGSLIQSIQPALVDCDCKVDIPALRSVMWRILANTKPVAEVRVAVDRGAKPLALPATTPWREAQKRLPQAGPVWLALP